ncbi:hypothetical protein [Pseudactinotalea sp. HY158]|uniref:hypothetical protein n=1 Tax=Pseudactinotalea sp. HY158 TaxID=2654547 RepID=UPI0018928157|nr:hypothetical protein [Pseudactinotalea sp. HY158]
MSRRILAFIALAISILYGAGFTLFRDVDGYPAVGGAIVALAWIATGMFGRSDDDSRRS